MEKAIIGKKIGMTQIFDADGKVIPVTVIAVSYTHLSLHAYWDNAVGLLTQFFYLPLLRLGAIVAMWTGQVFWFYFGAFLLLVLSSWLGCRAKDPVKK